MAGAGLGANDSRVPQLLVPGKEKAEREPLRMSGLEIDVEVLGNLATTTLTMTFRNDLDRVLEGELVFPLGDGESVSRFAMSMGGIETLREGVVVEKAKGRQVFESIVRSQVDPGLLEMTKGNNFRSRVYPIPPKGEKRIVVGYEGTLRDTGGGFVYSLPLAFGEPIDDFSASVRIAAGPGGAVTFEGGLLEGAPVKVDGGVHRALVGRADFVADGVLRFEVGKAEPGGVQTVVHREEGRKGGKTYFRTVVPVAAGEREKPKPGKLCLLWDASGSSGGRDVEAELELLGGYFQKLGDVEVSLVVFRDRPGEAEAFAVKGGDWSGLRERLEAARPDGGTGLGAIDLGDYPCDGFVFVSDGLATFGGGEMKLGDKPVVAISSSPAADHAYLRGLARRSGGRYVNLVGVKDPVAVVDRLMGERLIFLGAEGGDGRVGEFFPRRGASPEGGSLVLSGIAEGEGEVELTLNFGYGDRVVESKTVVIGGDGGIATPRARRLWAEAKIAELSLDYADNEEVVVAVAKEHGIVTRGTSLIVLDSLEDYLRYRVVPPEELREEYFERIEAAELAEEAPLREHLDAVAERFEERKKWYNEEFPGLEAATLAAAKFEVMRARALVKATGIRLFKKRKVVAESLEPAERMLAEVEALAKRGEVLGDDGGARAEWEKELGALNGKLLAFSQDHDKRYPDYQRANANEDGEGDLFGADRHAERVAFGSAFFSAEAEPQEALRAALSEEGRGIDDAFSAGDGAEYDPPEIPQPANAAAPSAGLSSNGGDIPDVHTVFGGRLTKTDGDGRPAAGGIALKKWDPDTPYLKEMRRAEGDDVYRVYLKARRKNEDSSAFFLDVADHFLESGRRDLALRALSNIAEMELESAPLLRILGHRLLQIGEAALAASVFEEVLEIRGEEPQSYRDLARAKEALGDNKRAAELLWEVVRRPWDDRFDGIDQIALVELNRLIEVAGAEARPEGMDARLSGSPMPVDLRVVLTWDADNTDIDLWVIDSSGEVCKYDHDRTLTGGRMSEDYTQGYGPEEFVIRDALPGEYVVKAHYYGNSQQTLAGATTIQAEIFTGYGRSGEEAKSITLRLREEEDIVEVGKVSVGR